MGCEWCAFDTDGRTALKAPYCTSLNSCFGGVQGLAAYSEEGMDCSDLGNTIAPGNGSDFRRYVRPNRSSNACGPSRWWYHGHIRTFGSGRVLVSPSRGSYGRRQTRSLRQQRIRFVSPTLRRICRRRISFRRRFWRFGRRKRRRQRTIERRQRSSAGIVRKREHGNWTGATAALSPRTTD